MSAFIKFFKRSKISDEDRASKIVHQLVTSGNCKNSVFLINDKSNFPRTLALIYTEIYIKVNFRTKFDNEVFEELKKIIEYNEDDMVRFLKYKIWNYRKVLNSETKKFLEEWEYMMNMMK
jgi:hypothetical protein